MRSSNFAKAFAAILICSGGAYAASPSVSDVENLIRQHQYLEAEVALERVVAENPNSAKAHYYLGQVYQINGQPQAAKVELDKYWANPVKNKQIQVRPEPVVQPTQTQTKKESHDGAFWSVMFCIIIAGIAAFFWLNPLAREWLNQKINGKKIDVSAQKRRTVLLQKCINAKKSIKSSMTMLKVNGHQESALYDKFKYLLEASNDAIEILTKGDGSCEEHLIHSMLADIEVNIRMADNLVS